MGGPLRARLDTDTALRAFAHPHRPRSSRHCPHRLGFFTPHRLGHGESQSPPPNTTWGLTRRHRVRSVPRLPGPCAPTDEDHAVETTVMMNCARPSHCFRYGLLADIVPSPSRQPQASANALRDKARHTYVIPGTRRTRVRRRDPCAIGWRCYRSGRLRKPCTRRDAPTGASPGACPPRVAEQLVLAQGPSTPRCRSNALIKDRARARHRPPPSRRRPCTACSRAKDSSTNIPMKPVAHRPAPVSPSATPASAGKAMSMHGPQGPRRAGLGERPTSSPSSTMPPGRFPSPPSPSQRNTTAFPARVQERAHPPRGAP